MKDYGLQRSTVTPPEVELTESKVFVTSNITPVDEPETEEQPGFTGYEFQLMEYDKDEFIKMQNDKLESQDEQILDLQFALCEVYETIAL